VYENIIPGIAPDETVAFLVVKPLHHALFFHCSSSFLYLYFNADASIPRNAQEPRLFSFRPRPKDRAAESPRRVVLFTFCRKHDRTDPDYTCKPGKKQLQQKRPDGDAPMRRRIG
jgi:hypothetical protein